MTNRPPARLTVRDIRGDDDGYVAFHAPRYVYVLDRLAEAGLTPETRVLDIGLSRLTGFIRDRFGCTVDSLGFGEDHDTQWGRHYLFDLNASQDPAVWRRDLPRYDVIVMAEVIEHLHTAPQLVLRFIRSLLKDDGLLLLQTPNAAGLTKRIKLLLGRNPYEMIRLDPTDPGHFREYTAAELRGLARDAGFEVRRTLNECYFDMRYGLHTAAGNRPRPIVGAIMNILYRSLPAPLRYGITMEWRPRAGTGLPPR